MPIKGLTDRRAPTFPKIGDIRKGAPKPKNGIGKDLTYFRAVFSEGETEAASKFQEVYGDEPREINIFLPFDEIDRNFDAFLERHTASALQCRGDGETAFIWRDENGEMQHQPKQCPAKRCTGCKETGRLKIIVPELRRLAYLNVHTTSKWDIAELTDNLDAIRRLTGNGLKGIPLVLKRRPRTISTPRAKGKRARQEMWLLSIEADPRWVDAQLRAMEAAALPATTTAQLTEVVEEITVDESTGEVLDEFEAEIVAEPEDNKPSEPNDEQPTTMADLWSRWREMCAEADNLGIKYGTLPADAERETIIKVGNMLADKIEQAKSK